MGTNEVIMAKPKKVKKAPTKTPEQIESLTADQVMRRVFGTEGRKVLKREIASTETRKKSDYRLP